MEKMSTLLTEDNNKKLKSCFSDWIHLNVGGKVFSTTRSTLIGRNPESMLARMFQDDETWHHLKDESGAVLFDRSPAYFEPILDYLRHGKLVVDSNVSLKGVLEEAKFFGFPVLVDELQRIIEEEKQDYKEPLTRSMVIKSLLSTPAKCELRFQGIDFSGADLSRLDLRYINFKLANLRGCNLSQTNLYCCSLERANLSGSKMDVALNGELSLMCVAQVNTPRVEPTLLDLAVSSFEKLGAHPTAPSGGWISAPLLHLGANLQGVRMICCNAEGCSMRGCNFDDPSGLKANMEGANLKTVDFEGSLMAGTNLRVATLKNSNLRNCDLRGAILAGTDLENCDLSGCDLFEANLRGCNVKGTKFEEMITPLHMTQTVP